MRPMRGRPGRRAATRAMGPDHWSNLRRSEAGEQLLRARLCRYVLIRFRGAFTPREVGAVVEVGLEQGRRLHGDQYPPLERLFAAVSDAALDRLATGRAGVSPSACGTVPVRDDDQLVGALFGGHVTAGSIRAAMAKWVADDRRTEVQILTQYLDLAERNSGEVPTFTEVARSLSSAGTPTTMGSVRTAVFDFCDLLLSR
jgi:hypothetical protein